MVHAKNYEMHLHLLKSFRENYWILFFRTWCRCVH